MRRNLIQAVLMVAVIFAVLPEVVAAQRIRVAVSPFLDRSGEKTMTTSSGGIGASGDSQAGTNFATKGDLGGQVADAIITELVKLNRYDVVERIQLEKVISEKKLQIGDLKDVSAASEAARILGADLLVTGSITEAASSTTGQGYLVLKKKVLTSRVVLDSRLVDVRTTKAIWGTTTTGSESLKSKKIVGFGKSALGGTELLLGKATRSAADQFVRQLIPVLDGFTVTTDISDLKTSATARGGKIYLGAGAYDGVRVGDQFELYSLGEPFQVGNKTIREEVLIGAMSVTEVSQEYATGATPSDLLGMAQEKLVEMTAKRKQ